MRPFVFFFTFFSFFSAAALVAARTETIGGQDKQIKYEGKWRNMESPGAAFTYLRQGRGYASLNLSNASRIAVTLNAERSDDSVLISLDKEDYTISDFSFQKPAWSSNLNPNFSHIIKVTKLNPDDYYTAIFSFSVTYPDSPEDTMDTALRGAGQSTFPANEAGTSSTPNSSESPSPPSTSSALSAQQPSTEPLLSGAKLAGVIVGCITVPAIILGILLYRRRMVKKRKAASTEYWDYLNTRVQQTPGPPPPPAPHDEGFDGAQAKEML